MTELCFTCQDGSVANCDTCSFDMNAGSHMYSCDSCLNGMVVVDGECVIEIANCDTYNSSDSTICDACETGYVPNLDGLSCASCSAAVGMPPGRCLACMDVSLTNYPDYECT